MVRYAVANAPYKSSNSVQGIISAKITQRLSAASFPPKGSTNSSGLVSCCFCLRYILMHLDARIFTYFTPFLCTLFLFSQHETFYLSRFWLYSANPS